MRLCFFTVTAADISSGERRNATSCPVALALIRAAGDAWPNEQRVRYRRAAMPSELRRYMERLDKGLQERPRTFVIDLDDAELGVETRGYIRSIPN